MKIEEQYPEVREFLEKLIDRGYNLIGFDDGGEDFLIQSNDLDEIVEAIHEVNECTVELTKDNKFVELVFVLGNNQGEALSDYSCSEFLSNDIEEVSEEIYNKYYN